MSRKYDTLSKAVNRALYGAAIVGTAFAAPAIAQENPVEEVVTTGSRIPVDPNLVTTSPVTTVSSAEISYSGVTRVEDLVNDLPQIVPSLTGNDSNGSTGTATLDLRGLGSDRTLVLINGHRMGFGDPAALAPDINQIPGALIKQVEVLTGGASSTYGSDAVAGVINFIMRDDFEGFEVNVQRSGYQHKNDDREVQAQIESSGFVQAPNDVTDGHTTDVNVIVGMNSADGNGNITGYLGYREIDAIRHAARDYSACALSSSNGETCAGSATLPTGLFSDFAGNYYTVEGDEFVPWDFSFYNYGPLNYFQRPDERFTGGLFGNYELADGVNGYAEFQFMDDRSLAQIAPSGAFFVTEEISCDNPFLSAQQAGVINSIDQSGMADPGDDGILGTPDDEDVADGNPDYPCVPGNGDVVPWYIGRRNVEGGPRSSDLRHTSLRSLVGIKGEINDDWSYDAFVNFARLRYSQTYNNDLSISKIKRALDVVVDDRAGSATLGQPVCQSVINGSDTACVPWNIFDRTNLNADGTSQAITQAQLNYIDQPLFSSANLSMNQGVAYVTGDLTNNGWVFPSAEQGVQVVAGLEYRDEQMDYDLDAGYNSGDGAGQGGATADVSGAILVKEFFTEAKIPLVENRPGIESMFLDLRYRRSDYDTGVDANTHNVGFEYSPNDEYRFRASLSRAVRAPNINELFQPVTLGLWAGDDPCAGPDPQGDFGLSAAQCALTGVTAAQYGSIPKSPAGQYNARFGGNTNLNEETSDSFTVGVVMTPESFASGLTLSLDYWSIDVQDAISSGVGQEFTITECANTGNPVVCDLINRGPNGNLWIGNTPFVVSQQVNIGKLDVAGFDLNATYGTEIGRHGLNFSLRGTLLDKWDDQPLAGGITNDCVGVIGGDCGRPRPEWKHTFSTVWTTPQEGLDVIGTWRHVGEVDEFRPDPRYKIKGQDYFDLTASYALEMAGGTTTITSGITNILDEDPPRNGFINNVGYSNGNTVPGTWDPLGRYWFLGFKHSR